MITLLHGNEEFLIAEALADIRRTVSADPGLGDLNLAILEGPVDVNALRAVAEVPPFLGSQRLVIVRNWLATFSRRPDDQWHDLVDVLHHLPDSTHLVFVENTLLPEQHPIFSALSDLMQSGRATVKALTLPTGRGRREAVLQWTRDRARALGLELDPQALVRLVDALGHNLRLLAQELEKLRTYVGPEGVITPEAVEALVPYTREASVFDLIDAIRRRDAPRAVRLLQSALAAGQHPLQVLALLARQYRIYIGLKDLDAQGLAPAEMAQRLGIPAWTVRRDLQVARRMRWEDLERTMERLLGTDVRVKRGDVDPVLALQVLVIALCQRS